jgi:hypothetical protein
MKDKKSRKETQKEKEKILLKTSEEENQASEQSDSPEEEDSDVEENEDEDDDEHKRENTFADDATMAMFGSAVSVVVTDNIPTQDEDILREELHLDENNSVGSRQSQPRRRNKDKESSFARAMTKAKQIVGSKKKKRRNQIDQNHRVSRDVKKKVKTAQLFAKLKTSGLKLKR